MGKETEVYYTLDLSSRELVMLASILFTTVSAAKQAADRSCSPEDYNFYSQQSDDARLLEAKVTALVKSR